MVLSFSQLLPLVWRWQNSYEIWTLLIDIQDSAKTNNVIIFSTLIFIFWGTLASRTWFQMSCSMVFTWFNFVWLTTLLETELATSYYTSVFKEPPRRWRPTTTTIKTTRKSAACQKIMSHNFAIWMNTYTICECFHCTESLIISFKKSNFT